MRESSNKQLGGTKNSWAYAFNGNLMCIRGRKEQVEMASPLSDGDVLTVVISRHYVSRHLSQAHALHTTLTTKKKKN